MSKTKSTIETTAQEITSPEVTAPSVGQRLMLTFDAVKPFTHKQEDGTELKLQRVYHFNVPYMSPYGEVYQVIDEIREEVKRQEIVTKENAAKLESEKIAKEKELAAQEASIS
jgi:hypothetical protein